jgi:hypothetical protein
MASNQDGGELCKPLLRRSHDGNRRTLRLKIQMDHSQMPRALHTIVLPYGAFIRECDGGGITTAQMDSNRGSTSGQTW